MKYNKNILKDWGGNGLKSKCRYYLKRDKASYFLFLSVKILKKVVK